MRTARFMYTTTQPKDVPSIPWHVIYPNTQVALWNRNGDVAAYDDTAVKNRYRMPIGVMVVMIFRVPNANGRPKHHGGYNDGCVRLVIL